MAYMAIFGILLPIVATMTIEAQLNYRAARRAFDDMDGAGRCLSDLRHDLQTAAGVTLPTAAAPTLTLVALDGSTVTYRFDPVEHTGSRADATGTREYGDSIESITFEKLGARIIRIDLTLRRRNPQSHLDPTWRTAVHCRNLAP
jgi:hypothetical protein